MRFVVCTLKQIILPTSLLRSALHIKVGILNYVEFEIIVVLMFTRGSPVNECTGQQNAVQHFNVSVVY